MATCNCGQDPHLPTCPRVVGARGIDDKRRLLGFFAQKGHHNLVLRIVDVLEMRNLARVAGMVAITREVAVCPADNVKGWLLEQFPDGYITIPIDRLLDPIALKDVAQIQEVVAEYRDIRMGKGEPSRKEMCPKCAGLGCDNCHEGSIFIFLEMSDEEIALARSSK